MEGSTAPLQPSPNAAHEEPRWHASVAVILSLALYSTLPSKLTFGPAWIAPLLIAGLLIPLSVLSPNRHQETPAQRIASIVLIAILNFFNIASIGLLIYDLLFSAHTHHTVTAVELLTAGAQIWTTNILVFSLWFWEIDGGGPEPRAHATRASEFVTADFLFPQMQMDKDRLACAIPPWKPYFLDYVYLAFTNALAFSPTDVMPLSRTAKMLMLAQSLISFVTGALILARSVNIIQ